MSAPSRAQLELDRDARRLRGVVDHLQTLGDTVGADEPFATDADRPADQAVERVDLGIGVPVSRRVGHLDAAAVIRPDRGLEEDRPDAADP